MSKGILKTEIFIDDLSNNNVRYGYVTVHCTDTIKLDSINGCVYFEVRGSLEGQKTMLTSFNICDEKIINKEEQYKFPFSFEIENETNTYIGKNVRFLYNCKVILEVNTNDVEKLERSLLSKVGSFLSGQFNASNLIGFSEYFEVEKLECDYKVIESKIDFNLKSNELIIFLLAILLGGIYLLFVPVITATTVCLGVLCVGFLTSFLMAIIKSYASKQFNISMKTFDKKDGFVCKLKKAHNYRLNHPVIYYEIIEKVIDRTGTTDSIYNEVIYTSEKKELLDFTDSATVEFEYPKEKGMYSTNYEDVSIYWQMKIEGDYFGGEYLGVILTYECSFVTMC